MSIHPYSTPETTPPVADLMLDLELATVAAKDLQSQLDATREQLAAERGLNRVLLRFIQFFGVLVGIAAIAVLCAGCTATDVTSPTGWRIHRVSVLGSLSVDEARYEESATTKSLTVSKAASDTTKALDVAAAALNRIPAKP